MNTGITIEFPKSIEDFEKEKGKLCKRRTIGYLNGVQEKYTPEKAMRPFNDPEKPGAKVIQSRRKQDALFVNKDLTKTFADIV